MKKKHVIISLFISLFGFVIGSSTADDLRGAVQVFNTGWFDFLKASVIGVVIGLIARTGIKKNKLHSLPAGILLVGIIGIGAIGVGIIGAVVVYLRYEDLELIRVPLHASVVGLAAYCIYLVSQWRLNEEI